MVDKARRKKNISLNPIGSVPKLRALSTYVDEIHMFN